MGHFEFAARHFWLKQNAKADSLFAKVIWVIFLLPNRFFLSFANEIYMEF